MVYTTQTRSLSRPRLGRFECRACSTTSFADRYAAPRTHPTSMPAVRTSRGAASDRHRKADPGAQAANRTLALLRRCVNDGDLERILPQEKALGMALQVEDGRRRARAGRPPRARRRQWWCSVLVATWLPSSSPCCVACRVPIGIWPSPSRGSTLRTVRQCGRATVTSSFCAATRCAPAVRPVLRACVVVNLDPVEGRGACPGLNSAPRGRVYRGALSRARASSEASRALGLRAVADPVARNCCPRRCAWRCRH